MNEIKPEDWQCIESVTGQEFIALNIEHLESNYDDLHYKLNDALNFQKRVMAEYYNHTNTWTIMDILKENDELKEQIVKLNKDLLEAMAKH